MTDLAVETAAWFDQFNKRPYERLFGVPSGEWQVEAIWDDAYYRSARLLLRSVADGPGLPALEGVAGLYLFRHYLELALKYCIFHSRWLADASTNARNEEIRDVKRTHSLAALWHTAREEAERIIPAEELARVDMEFVDRCVSEWQAVDPNGERFRYHGDRFGVARSPEENRRLQEAFGAHLCADFRSLLVALEHVHAVLEYLDTYFVETHGQNEEWQDYLNSL